MEEPLSPSCSICFCSSQGLPFVWAQTASCRLLVHPQRFKGSQDTSRHLVTCLGSGAPSGGSRNPGGSFPPVTPTTTNHTSIHRTSVASRFSRSSAGSSLPSVASLHLVQHDARARCEPARRTRAARARGWGRPAGSPQCHALAASCNAFVSLAAEA